MFQERVVKVLPTQVGVTRGGLDSENTTSYVEEGDIESASSKIEDENITLCLRLRIEAVSNGGGCGFVDDAENLKTSDCAGVFGSQTLGVVEIGRYAE